jgi:hypothetical protein
MVWELIFHYTDSYGFEVFQQTIRDATDILGNKNELLAFFARGDMFLNAG